MPTDQGVHSNSLTHIEKVLLDDILKNKEIIRRNLCEYFFQYNIEFANVYWARSDEYIVEFSIDIKLNETSLTLSYHSLIYILSKLIRGSSFLLVGPPGTGKTDFSIINSGFGIVPSIVQSTSSFDVSFFATPYIGNEGVGVGFPNITPLGMIALSGYPYTIDEVGELRDDARSVLLTILSDRFLNVYGYTIYFDEYAPIYLTTNKPGDLPIALIDRVLPMILPGYNQKKFESIIDRSSKSRVIRDTVEEVLSSLKESNIDILISELTNSISKYVRRGDLSDKDIGKINDVLSTIKQISPVALQKYIADVDIYLEEFKNTKNLSVKSRMSLVKRLYGEIIGSINTILHYTIIDKLWGHNSFSSFISALSGSRFYFLLKKIKNQQIFNGTRYTNPGYTTKGWFTRLHRELFQDTLLYSSARAVSYFSRLLDSIETLYTVCDVSTDMALAIVPLLVFKSYILKEYDNINEFVGKIDKIQEYVLVTSDYIKEYTKKFKYEALKGGGLY